jgi:hypothetical protein
MNVTQLNSVKSAHSKRRITGITHLNPGGRSPMLPELDERLLQYFKSMRDRNFTVNLKMIITKVRRLRPTIENLLTDFVGTKSYVQSLMRRHKIGRRRITHQGQQSRATRTELKNTLTEYIQTLHTLAANHSHGRIYNFDEVPSYFDTLSGSTLAFQGDRHVECKHTGH